MLESAIHRYGRTKHFSSATVDRWLAAAPADRDALLAVVEALRLGENQFRDVFDQAQEIASRRQCTVADVLTCDAIRAVLARGVGRNEAVRALKRSLRRLRYPQLAEAERRLGGATKALGLPPEVEVRFPENLEGEEVSVRLRARSAAQLREQVGKLSVAVQRAEIEEIFRILEGDW